MKSRLLGFVNDIEHMKGPESEMLKPHIPHFHDIVKTIDWKLEIFTRVCPLTGPDMPAWKGPLRYECRSCRKRNLLQPGISGLTPCTFQARMTGEVNQFRQFLFP